MKCCGKLVFLARVSVALGCFASTAAAQEPAPSRADGPAPASAEESRVGRRTRTLRLRGWELVGDPRKPAAFYVLSRSETGGEVLELRTSFVPEIVRTVDRRPF